MAPLSDVLRCSMVLGLLGDPRQLRKEAENCLVVLVDTDRRAFVLDDEMQESLMHILGSRAGELRDQARIAQEALQGLSDADYDYSFERSMAIKGKGASAPELFRVAVELVLAEVAPSVLARGEIPSQPVRGQIAGHLRSYFPPELTDTSSSGKLYKTLANICGGG